MISAIDAGNLTQEDIGRQVTVSIAGVTLNGELTELQASQIRIGIRNGGTTYLHLNASDLVTIDREAKP